MAINFKLQLWLTVAFSLSAISQAIQWDQSTYLDEDFRLLWNIRGDEITFEMQVRTHGYIGLGFARKEDRSSADVVIGWVDRGQTYFQVSLLN